MQVASTGQTRAVITTSAHNLASRYEYGSKDTILVAMTNHLACINVFISILEQNLTQPAMGQCFQA